MEILQSAFVTGIEKQKTIQDGESVVAWFYRVLRNAVIDHYRYLEPAIKELMS